MEKQIYNLSAEDVLRKFRAKTDGISDKEAGEFLGNLKKGWAKWKIKSV